ncbi:GntR family transcriptional regulator [Roseburia hominis]
MDIPIKLNHTSPTPLYYQLRQQIRNYILDETWPYGTEIPSELKLSKELKLSRATIKQAYDGLVNEGLITRKQGKGTFVSYRQSEFDIIQEPNFYQRMDTLGAKQNSKIIESGYIPADPYIASKLNIAQGTEICYFKRVRYIDNIPSIIQTVYIRKDYSANLIEKDLASISFHRYLEENANISLNCFDMKINAITLDAHERDLLESKRSIPGFRFHTVYWYNDIPIVYNERVFRGDNLHLALHFNFTRDNSSIPKINSFGVCKDET